MRSHDKLLVFYISAVGMAKGAKKRRIGSDDYTLDLERRIGDLEKFMATFKHYYYYFFNLLFCLEIIFSFSHF